MSRTGKAPYECHGCNHKFDLEFIKPNVMTPTTFKVECPNCESRLQGQVVMPKFRQFPNHVQIHTFIIRPSEKLIAMLKNGEVSGEQKIKAPNGGLIKI